MITELDTNFIFNKSLDKNKLLSNPLINDMFSKCKKYKNSIFETYDKYNYDTVYAIGDIHGDYEALIKILKHINCIIEDKDETFKADNLETNQDRQSIEHYEYHWNPELKNTCIIQVGDIMGKKHASKSKGYFLLNSYKPEEIKCVKLLLKLSDEAIKYNSRIILLYGNHDIMELYNTINYNQLVDIYKELSDLSEKILCNYHSVCIVNSYIFSHAGFDLELTQNLLKIFEINEELFVNLNVSDKLYLINVCVASLLNGLLTSKINNYKIKQFYNIILNIFEHRKYSKVRHLFETEHYNVYKVLIMKNITKTKMLFDVNGIIIGHNQTVDYKIHQFEDLYDIDVKISEGFGSNIKNEVNQILKINKDKLPEIIEVINK